MIYIIVTRKKFWSRRAKKIRG